MLLFERLSIRVKLIAPVLVISLMLVGSLTLLVFRVLLPQMNQASELETANQLTRWALAAARAEASERGLTESYLWGIMAGQANPSLLARVKQQRQAGDEALQKALALVTDLPQNDYLDAAHDRILQDLKTLNAARDRVNQSAPGKVREKPWDWKGTITNLITTTSNLRTAAFSPTNYRQRVIYNNTQLQQSIWLATEYTERSRDILANAAAQHLPLESDEKSKVAQYADDIARQLDTIGHLGPALLNSSSNTQLASQFDSAWKAVQTVVMGSYRKLSDSMLDGAGSGNYPVEKDVWVQRSDKAIGLLDTLNQAAQASAQFDAQSSSRTNTRLFVLVASEIGVGVILALLTILVTVRISGRVGHAERGIAAVESERDLSLRLQAEGSDEISRLGQAFNAMLERFEGIIAAVRKAATEVASGTDQVASASEQTERGVQEQQDATHQVATAMNQMSATVQEVARNTAEAATQADNAATEARSGQSVVDETIKSIRALAEQVRAADETIRQLENDSKDIGQVLKVINDISEQTNLLALNAAIEAARAGDHGRGFAVVAGEVRTLARRTQESTQAIQDIIERLQTQSSRAVEAMSRGQGMSGACVEQTQRAGEALGRIVSTAEQITDMNTQIATAAEEQASVADEIDRNINSITHAAEQTTEVARTTVSTAGDIRRQMETLTELVGSFRISGS
ncbi:methyl-accepting chemotaxis protein [Mangrovitalea sediminis]|uniref:methyl-accepting chemotaxis protein n=1 Tax=Mangrovitalea sediminis TaxID=1982043 RepID=UPI000BE5D5FC|nr:methyl-accepting chemotaxis protein [Mangrovitalea sediminis]